jgi:hypothetical protein
MLLLIASLRFATNLFLIESCVRLVAVAQLAEHRIVAPSPVGHPHEVPANERKRRSLRFGRRRLWQQWGSNRSN